VPAERDFGQRAEVARRNALAGLTWGEGGLEYPTSAAIRCISSSAGGAPPTTAGRVAAADR
jgi:hypothetical protein